MFIGSKTINYQGEITAVATGRGCRKY